MKPLSHTDKLSRNVIFKKLLDLKSGERTLNDYDLDALINYFSPSVPKKPKDAFDWVAKAVADDRDVRFYLRYVYVEDGVMVGCSGARLHTSKTDLPNGFYHPESRLRVEVDAKYPQWQRILKKRASLSCDPYLKEWEISATILNKKDFFFATFGGVKINKTYLDESLAKVGSVYWDSGAIYGDSEFGEFVIQGMRL